MEGGGGAERERETSFMHKFLKKVFTIFKAVGPTQLPIQRVQGSFFGCKAAGA